ncbi:MAG: hypothetical protein MI862_07470 [Desulfobacterales bacterium]|nr:hypothetical protein [Desulfobacterales bacterium]
MLFKSTSSFGDRQFPIKINIINKNQAKYDTPINAFIASYSATIAKDLDWVLETLTKEASEQLVSIFEKHNIDLNEIVEHDGFDEDTFIISEFPYKESIILIVIDVSHDGSITKIPLTFVLENNEWKKTNKFENDENVNQYIVYYKRAPMETQTVVSYSGVRYDRRTRQFYSDATITNISGKTLEGPVWLKITNLQPGDAKMVNADGMHFNEPYIIMLEEEKKWLPGQALPSKTLYFTNPANEIITFDDIVFAVEPEEGS